LSEFTIRTVSNMGELTVLATGPLEVTGGQTLEGRLIVPGGTKLTVNIYPIAGKNTLTVIPPNQLIGVNTTNPTAPQLFVYGGIVAIYSTATTSTDITAGTWYWRQELLSGWKWEE